MRRTCASIVIGLVIAFAIACLPAAPAGASQPVWRLQQKANEATSIGELAKADRILVKARKRAPANPYLAFDHAGVLASQGRTAQAVAALEAAVEHGFRHESALLESEALEPLGRVPSWDRLLAAVRVNETEFQRLLEEARRPLDPADGTEFPDIAALLEAKEQADRDFYDQESDEPHAIRRARFTERWVASLIRLARETEDRDERDEAMIFVLRERLDGAVMLDLYWSRHAIETVVGAADSYLEACPEGAHATEARLARVLADIVAPAPEDLNTPRAEWPEPRCAEALPVLSELGGMGAADDPDETDDEWIAVARGIEAVCLERVAPDRHADIGDAARAYLERERTFSSYDLMLVGSLKVALWRIEGLPQFEARGLDGEIVSLDDFRGRITLLDFWSPG